MKKSEQAVTLCNSFCLRGISTAWKNWEGKGVIEEYNILNGVDEVNDYSVSHNKQVGDNKWLSFSQGVNERKVIALSLCTLSPGNQTDFHGENCNYFMHVVYKTNAYTRKSVLKPSVLSDCLLEVPFQQSFMYVCNKYWTLCKVIAENGLTAQSSSLKKEVFHFRRLKYTAGLTRLIPTQHWQRHCSLQKNSHTVLVKTSI